MKRILIVEDEPDHLMAVKLIFDRENDIEVLGAQDTSEADRVLEGTDIDLILLDIALPGEDGLVFCRRLREQPRYESLPVVALSAFPDQLWRERALEAGCTDFVSKPFEPSRLVEIVKRYTGG